MQPDDDDCHCVRDLEKREIMSEFANSVANEVVDMIGGICPAMVDYTLSEVMARLAHVAVMSHDETLESLDQRRTAEAVEKYVFKLSKTLPAVVVRIMQESKMKEEPNARN